MVFNIRPDELITFEDGYQYWHPRGYEYGAFSAHTLRKIADRLDAINYEWDKQVSEYFEKEHT